jgi:hypothetical protein
MTETVVEAYERYVNSLPAETPSVRFSDFERIYQLRDAEVQKLRDDLAPHCAMIIKLRKYSDDLMKVARDAGELAERYADDLKDSIRQSEELLDINRELSAMVRRFIGTGTDEKPPE